MVVYGLLDSHTLLSHASSVRLDSFVYTVEGFREARARLKDRGVLSLSFALITNEIGRKIHHDAEEAFDGRPPLCLSRAVRRLGHLLSEDERRGARCPPDGHPAAGLLECMARFAEPGDAADVSTDDWPFLYMPRRTYPVSYMAMIAVVLALSLFLIANFTRTATAGNLPFFLLGAGFMLVETKGITEMGLAFGNTWQVIGIVDRGHPGHGLPGELAWCSR